MNDLDPAGRSPFELGDWRVEPDRLRLLRGDESRKLEPMAMRLLLFLAERPAEVISRAEVLQQVWEGRAVVDETLSRAVSLVRQALGDNAQNPTYIETIPKRGYRLIASVRPDPAESTPGVETSVSNEVAKRKPSAVMSTWGILLALVILLALLMLWQVGPSDEQTVGDRVSPATATGEASQRPGIAVLPFKNLSPDLENAYLADGLTEQIIHQLAEVSGLRVVSRTSSMSFRDSAALAPDIARTLRVDYLLEGTVLVVDQRVRISARLIRPETDDHLLSRTYDRSLSEILDLQREVAKDVAEHTRTQLSPREAIRLAREQPVSSDAYRAYLQGRQLVEQRRELDRGLALLEQSVELDPAFAPAWAALADAFLLGNSYLGMAEDSAYAGAEVAIGKALVIDPDFAAVHASLGLLRLQRDRDWSGSESSYRRAIELEQSYVAARQWYSELLSLLGRHQEALEQVTVALELDPLSPLIHAVAAQRLSAAGRYQEALERFQDAEVLGADYRWLSREKMWALARLGRHQESVELRIHSAQNQWPLDGDRVAELERGMQENGVSELYRWNLQNVLARDHQLPGFPTWLAAAYSETGQTEQAFQWLEKAVAERNLWLVHFMKSPAFDAIRDSPRFHEILGDLPPWRPEVAPPS